MTCYRIYCPQEPMNLKNSASLQKTILAVSSSGGHWQQLMSISSALSSCRVSYVTTLPGLAEIYDLNEAKVVTDFNRNEPLRALRCAKELFIIINSTEPDFILTTGAAPGLIAIIIGRVKGIRTIWIDSIANSEKMSLSGKLACLIADLCITQWMHLSTPKGPKYFGEIL